MGIIIFIIILAVLVLAHEFGHFILAKRSDIKVEEFGLGFPPRLFSWQKGETVYSINAIPFGGFVKIFGENPDEESISGSDKNRSLVNKSKWVQAAVLAAGVFFNIILAWVLISTGLAFGLPTSESGVPPGYELRDTSLIVTSTMASSPAEKAGLEAGDIILSIGSGVKKYVNPSAAEVQDLVSAHEGQTVVLEVKKNLSSRTRGKVAIGIVPKRGAAGGNGLAIGISMDKIGLLKLPWWQALYEGLLFTGGAIITTVLGVIGLITGLISGSEALSQVMGPVGLAGIVGNVSALGFSYLLGFTAIISVNLAIINLIPFPALDGGRLLFLLIEAIKGSPIRPRIANLLNTAGFILLLVLMLAITYKDIIRLTVG